MDNEKERLKRIRKDNFGHRRYFNIIDLNRGSGKTTFLLIYSALSGKPIITPTEKSKELLKARAKKFKLNIPDPYSAEDIVINRCFLPKNNSYLVDDYDLVSSILIQGMLDINIDVALMTANNTEEGQMKKLHEDNYNWEENMIIPTNIFEEK